MKRWNDYEDEVLRCMKNEGESEETIGAKLDRTPRSVRGRWQWLTMSDDMRERRRIRVRAYRHSNYSAGGLFGASKHTSDRERRDPPIDVIADRDRRAMAVRTLTAVVMGDPEPGRSALDRRIAG